MKPEEQSDNSSKRQRAERAARSPYNILGLSVCIAGSAILGDFVQVGGQAAVAGHLTVGDFAQIAGQSGVISDVEPRAVVMGTPAQPKAQFFRQVAFLKRIAGAARVKS